MTALRRASALAATTLLVGGCFSLLGDAKHPDMHRHVIDAAAGVVAHAGAAPGLAVRTFSSRSRYDIRVVRRDGADSFTYLEFDRWGEVPVDAATVAVREGLAASGAFASVSSADDALAVERSLDGYLLGFELVKAPSGPWKARFAVRFSLVERGGKLLHSAVYDVSHDLPGSSPEGLGPAMSAAIGDAVNRALADWTAAGLMK